MKAAPLEHTVSLRGLFCPDCGRPLVRPLLVATLILPFLLFPAPGTRAGDDSTLVVACGADRYSKARHYLSFAKMSPYVWITEPLVFRGDDYKPKPGLIESWEREGRTYRLHVRKGVFFHNGRELDAEAVVHSLKINALNRSETLRIDPESYRILDKYTLELTTAHTTRHFVGFMSHPFISAYAPDTDFINHPVGTGPFMFKSYQRDRYIEVVRNENYWREKPPNKRVVYRFMPDPQTRLMALLNNECDIVAAVDAQMLAALPKGGGFKVLTPGKPRSYICLTVNIHGDPPFDLLGDLEVRRALAFAIDRKMMARAVFMDKARPAKSILAPWFWDQGDDFLEGYGHQPNKAKQMLEAAGWKPGPDKIRVKDGRRLRLRLVSGWPTASALKPLPEMIQQMVKEVGIELELIQIDDDGVYYGNYMAPGQGDLFLEKAGNSGGLTPTWLLYMLYHSKSPWSDSGYKWTLPGREFDDHIDQAQASDDPAEILRHLQGAQRVLIDQVCSVIPLLHAPNYYLARPNVDFDPEPAGGYEGFGYAVKH